MTGRCCGICGSGHGWSWGDGGAVSDLTTELNRHCGLGGLRGTSLTEPPFCGRVGSEPQDYSPEVRPAARAMSGAYPPSSRHVDAAVAAVDRGLASLPAYLVAQVVIATRPERMSRFTVLRSEGWSDHRGHF